MKYIKKILGNYPARVGLLILLYYATLQSGLLAPVNDLFRQATVVISSSIVDILGQNAYAIGDIIITKGKSLIIGYGCEGSEPVIVYSLAVLALSGSLKKKIKHVAVGSVILYVLNIGRVIGLIETLIRNEDYLDLMHHNVFPLIITGGVFLLWVNSMKKIGS